MADEVKNMEIQPIKGGTLYVTIQERPDGSRVLYLDCGVPRNGSTPYSHFLWVKGEWVKKELYGVDTDFSFEVK